MGVGSPFLPCEVRGSASCCQTRWHTLSLAQSSSTTLEFFETFITWKDGKQLSLRVATEVA